MSTPNTTLKSGASPVLRALEHVVVVSQVDRIIEQLILDGKAWKCQCGFLNATNGDSTCESCGKPNNQIPKSITELDSAMAAVNSPAWIKPGVPVWAKRTNGERIRCTIRSKANTPPKGMWRLESHEHGYGIVHHHSELEPRPTSSES